MLATLISTVTALVILVVLYSPRQKYGGFVGATFFNCGTCNFLDLVNWFIQIIYHPESKRA